jgi:carbon starvation protein
MNSVGLLILVLISFGLGYFIYLRLLIRKIFPLDYDRKTPAVEINDGLDYVPAKHWLILFGHHFASIAGAAPILGPVIAFSIWGWLPAILWIVLGSVFLGGVHDFSSLYISLRNKGVSVSEVGSSAISPRTKYLYSGFILLTLILIIAVFEYFCAKTFVNKPEIVLPSLGLIPIAIIVGFLIYRLNFNTLFATLLGLLGLGFLIYLGEYFPLTLPHTITNPLNFWIITLMFYCIFAAILPVNILLQPRDYLSSFLLFAGVGLGVLGIVFTHPTIVSKGYIGFSGKLGPLFPMLFVTIACGAISGFHSLISSGTTSKQLPNERYAPRIGYGAMLMEGLLASIALIAVACLKPEVFKATLSSSSPVACFGKGYGILVSPFLKGYGSAFAVLILNAFILTTLDTATRISRYVGTELFKFKGRIIPTLIPVILATLLALSGKWMNLWTIFGASNQLIAGLALIVVTAWLVTRKRNSIYTLIPAVFMLVITIWALIYKLINFMRTKNITLSIISVILIVLAVAVVWSARFIFVRRRNE